MTEVHREGREDVKAAVGRRRRVVEVEVPPNPEMPG